MSHCRLWLLFDDYIYTRQRLHYCRAGSLIELPDYLALRLLRSGGGCLYVSFPSNTEGGAMTAFVPRHVMRVTAPAIEPVTLAEAKEFLRLDGEEEDQLISHLLRAARIMAEAQTGKSLISQQWQVAFDNHAPAELTLPHGPVQHIVSVAVVDAAGNSTALAADQYRLLVGDRLRLPYAIEGHQLRVDYMAGFGDTAEEVPQDLRQSILIYTSHLHAHRDSTRLPMVVQLIFQHYRDVRI